MLCTPILFKFCCRLISRMPTQIFGKPSMCKKKQHDERYFAFYYCKGWCGMMSWRRKCPSMLIQITFLSTSRSSGPCIHISLTSHSTALAHAIWSLFLVLSTPLLTCDNSRPGVSVCLKFGVWEEETPVTGKQLEVFWLTLCWNLFFFLNLFKTQYL